MSYRVLYMNFLAGAFLCGLAILSTAANAQDRKLLCSSKGAGDISMNVIYRERIRNRTVRRKKFSVSFEAAPNGNYQVGERMRVIVNGVIVARPILNQIINGGDVIFDVNFDTAAQPNDVALPFPVNFPSIGNRARVAIRKGSQFVLACNMR